MKFKLLFLAGLFLSGCYAREAEKTGREGEVMPSFELLSVDSLTHFSTDEITKGRPSILFYFGPQCSFSREQMEEIVRNIEKLKDIQIYVFTRAPITDTKRFYEDFQLYKYKNIKVGSDYSSYFSKYFNIPGVPYMAIYRKDKTLANTFLGQIKSGQIIRVAKS